MIPEVLKILMLEDLEEDAGLADRILKKDHLNFVRTRVDTREEFMESLVAFKPDVILSDHSLPMFNSIEALQICKEMKVDVPFILVTGAVSEEFALNCIRLGAYDYILKTNLSRLPQAIRQAVHKYWAEKNIARQEQTLQLQHTELNKVNNEIDSFVYRISHDFRAPLASILGLVEIAKIEQQPSLENSRYYLSLIEKNVRGLDVTLGEILDYYKNARTDLEIERINFTQIVQKVIEQLKIFPGFETVSKQVSIQFQEDFFSDSFRVLAIFSNLLSNAIKYRDERKADPHVEIIVKGNLSSAVIEVSDNGIGIHEDFLPKIFDMFFRASENSKGAGLGLYIAKEMVEKLRGSITVESKLGHHTVFRVTLPNLKPPSH